MGWTIPGLNPGRGNRNAQRVSGAHSASSGYRGLSDRGLRLITHFRLMPRLRMSGVIPPNPPLFLYCVYTENFTSFLLSRYCDWVTDRMTLLGPLDRASPVMEASSV
jgi:hypothetical protein